VGYSKRQFVEAAFAEIGLASYAFDLQPQDLEQVLRRLDAMMAEWNAKGIRLGYPLPGSPREQRHQRRVRGA
jgi:RNase H-fold protein (predicted Holliday junction resolvase)